MPAAERYKHIWWATLNWVGKKASLLQVNLKTINNLVRYVFRYVVTRKKGKKISESCVLCKGLINTKKFHLKYSSPTLFIARVLEDETSLNCQSY